MFLTFNPKQTHNHTHATPTFTKPSYFRSNRFKLSLVTNCTQKDIRAIMGQNRGQNEGDAAISGGKIRHKKMKNKKSQKKSHIKIENWQRSGKLSK